MIADILGYFAGFTSTIFMIPQLYKIVITKKVEDISVKTTYTGMSSPVMWISHGLIVVS